MEGVFTSRDLFETNLLHVFFFEETLGTVTENEGIFTAKPTKGKIFPARSQNAAINHLMEMRNKQIAPPVTRVPANQITMFA